MTLRISWGASIDLHEMTNANGYGYATDRIVHTLRSIGYEVNYMDKSADVHFHFDQPQHFKKPRPDIYSIVYHPWESTLLMDGWSDVMNTADEVWTPSPVIADWYQKYAGITRPVFVYEHGVDPVWKAKPRVVQDTFKFLHVGGEANRKGVTETMKAMRLAFPNPSTDVELNLKIISQGWKIGKLRRVNVLNQVYTLPELVELYQSNHVFVYPSYGEGFGLTPLQAMATGMPTITLPGWAPYKDFLNPNLSISSGFTPSPWPKIHPGMMLKPNMDDLVDAMRYAHDNYREVTDHSYGQVNRLKGRYDWEELTLAAFTSLENRLKNI